MPPATSHFATPHAGTAPVQANPRSDEAEPQGLALTDDGEDP
jgi:hypothetical protein